jgi:hypothetical protein
VSLLSLLPKEKRPVAIAYAALELLCEASVTFSDQETFTGDEMREILGQILEDAKNEGMIGSWRRTINRFEITRPRDLAEDEDEARMVREAESRREKDGIPG